MAVCLADLSCSDIEISHSSFLLGRRAMSVKSAVAPTLLAYETNQEPYGLARFPRLRNMKRRSKSPPACVTWPTSFIGVSSNTARPPGTHTQLLLMMSGCCLIPKTPNVAYESASYIHSTRHHRKCTEPLETYPPLSARQGLHSGQRRGIHDTLDTAPGAARNSPGP